MITINDNAVISLCENEARELYKQSTNAAYQSVRNIQPWEMIRDIAPLDYHLGFNDYKLKLEGEGYEIY